MTFLVLLKTLALHGGGATTDNHWRNCFFVLLRCVEMNPGLIHGHDAVQEGFSIYLVLLDEFPRHLQMLLSVNVCEKAWNPASALLAELQIFMQDGVDEGGKE